MRLLITGGAGFIGSHLADYFSKAGHEVHIADRLSYAGKIRNIEKWLRGTKLWIGNLTDAEFTDKLAAYPFQVVIHTAANTHVDRSIADPIQFTLDNVLGTNQLLNSLQKYSDAERVVIYSTDEVYGPTPTGECFKESALLKPSNAYSASKVGVEGLASAYWTTHRLPIVTVRPCNTYGRRQHPEKVIPKFVSQAIQSKPLTVHNDGNGSRDWLHTSDHAAAIDTLLRHSKPGEAYNLAASDEHSDIEIARRILDILGLNTPINFVPGRPGHDRRYWMDGGKLRNLGWTPSMSFSVGFRDAVMWARDNSDWWKHDAIDLAA